MAKAVSKAKQGTAFKSSVKVAKNSIRSLKRGRPQLTCRFQETNSSREAAFKWAAHHRGLLTGNVDATNELANFAFWIAYAMLAGEISEREARTAAALIFASGLTPRPLAAPLQIEVEE